MELAALTCEMFWQFDDGLLKYTDCRSFRDQATTPRIGLPVRH